LEDLLFLEYIINPSKRTYWVYILSSIFIAFIYIYFNKKASRVNFSSKLWLHESAKLDYYYFILSYFIKTVMIIPIIISAKTIAFFVSKNIYYQFGFNQIQTISYENILILYTISLFIVSDFTRYWLHRFLHTIPFLWEFHKVHHSAKVLNPLTFYRVHPIENILFGLRYSFAIGFVTGIFIYFFGSKIGLVEILGANAFIFVFSIIGSNLRHSHIPLAYFSFLEKIFISPKQHQIHHSKKHFNKNFGGYLALWDYIFGTLELSKNVKVLKFGLRKEQMEDYNSLTKLIITPFSNILKKEKFILKYLKTATTVAAALILFVGCTNQELSKEDLVKQTKQKEALGQALFFDKNLSKNRTQSCSTCHNPETAFTDNRDNGISKMASLGDDGESLGDRQAPTAMYAMFSPEFHYDKENKKYIGGQFWDGREASLAGQAGGPPLNPIEMGMSSKKEVVKRLKENPYYIQAFKDIYGEDIFKNIDKAYFAMTDSIEKFEMTEQFAPFDSKYDRYLKGEYDLTPLEDLGRSLFFSQANNSCATCHLSKKEDAMGETFTNHEYHNIGTPINYELRSKNGVKDIDMGLLANPKVSNEIHKGKHKVPTLRNVAVTAPYMHNGVFKDLRTVVEFYDKYNNSDRTINPETKKPWDEPEVKETISLDELKAKKQNDRKIDALVAFMKLLTDKRYEHLLEENK